jgi:hypothetical protein
MAEGFVLGALVAYIIDNIFRFAVAVKGAL